MVIVRKENKVVDLQMKSFADEEELRGQLLENFNQIIRCKDFSEIDEKFIVWRTEFPLSVGSIDLLAVGDGGGIYLIETKLFKNPDRRKVIAQVFDYASALWNEYGSKPEEFLAKVREGSYELPEYEEFKRAVGQNLRDARYTIIVAMDNLTPETKNLMEFLNKHTDFKVLALQVERYVGGEIEVILPKIYGVEISREPILPPHRPPITWEEFITNCTNPAKELYQNLKQIAENRGDELSPGAKSFSYYVSYEGGYFCLFTMWSNMLTIMKYNIESKVPPEVASKFREEIIKIEALKETYDLMKQPSLPLTDGEISGDEIKTFITAVEHLLNSIKSD